MSKETVVRIRKAIEEAQGAKKLRDQQEATKREAEALRLRTERQALINRNEARLRATGVVGLFEELIDSNVLTMSKDGDPAEIEWNSAKTRIVIAFDKFVHYEPDGDGHSQKVELRISLRARISVKGRLQINDHEMTREERLEDAVRDEILRLKGLKK